MQCLTRGNKATQCCYMSLAALHLKKIGFQSISEQ